MYDYIFSSKWHTMNFYEPWDPEKYLRMDPDSDDELHKVNTHYPPVVKTEFDFDPMTQTYEEFQTKKRKREKNIDENKDKDKDNDENKDNDKNEDKDKDNNECSLSIPVSSA